MRLLRSAWDRIEPAAVLLMLGDGFDPVAAEFALQMAATRRDVRSLALTAVDERDFDLHGSYVFEDPESGARIAADAVAVRDGFRQRFAEARQQLAQQLAGGGVRHLELVLDQPLPPALHALLGAAGRSR
jgi:uncharacterized protein (DUF58 family)